MDLPPEVPLLLLHVQIVDLTSGGLLLLLNELEMVFAHFLRRHNLCVVHVDFVHPIVMLRTV